MFEHTYLVRCSSKINSEVSCTLLRFCCGDISFLANEISPSWLLLLEYFFWCRFELREFSSRKSRGFAGETDYVRDVVKKKHAETHLESWLLAWHKADRRRELRLAQNHQRQLIFG